MTIGLAAPAGAEPWDEFTCLNSLRDVEPTVKLILLDDRRLDDETGERSGEGRRPAMSTEQ